MVSNHILNISWVLTINIFSLLTLFSSEPCYRHDLSETESDRAAELTRSLLAHSDKTVASTVYRVLHDLVTSLLGPRQALSDLDPCPRLRFLISTSVLAEIAGFGVTNADQQVLSRRIDSILLRNLLEKEIVLEIVCIKLIHFLNI